MTGKTTVPERLAANASVARAFRLILPIDDGEGDQAKPGGGVITEASASYPSTTLRVVPLPMRSMGRISSVDSREPTGKAAPMTLTLYYHPFSSFCQKVLVALYEREVPFERAVVDPSDPEKKAAFERLWPMAKFPVLRDEARGVTVPESSLIIEYLDRAHPGPPPLVPADPEAALQARLWDRFFDHYVEHPLQKVVGDALRPEGVRDPHGVEEAKAVLGRAYDLVEASLEDGETWIAGEDFSLADCGAAPALFYAAMVRSFGGRPRLEAYYARLRGRPSFVRAVAEAREFRPYFPLPWPEGWD